MNNEESRALVMVAAVVSLMGSECKNDCIVVSGKATYRGSVSLTAGSMHRTVILVCFMSSTLL